MAKKVMIIAPLLFCAGPTPIPSWIGASCIGLEFTVIEPGIPGELRVVEEHYQIGISVLLQRLRLHHGSNSQSVEAADLLGEHLRYFCETQSEIAINDSALNTEDRPLPQAQLI